MRELQSEIGEQSGIGSLGLAILAAGLFVVLGLSAIRGEVPRFLPALPIPLVVVAVRRFLATQKKQFRLIRLRRYYESAVQRAGGDWSGGVTGNDFADPDHAYTNDLNCFGEGSLF